MTVDVVEFTEKMIGRALSDWQRVALTAFVAKQDRDVIHGSPRGEEPKGLVRTLAEQSLPKGHIAGRFFGVVIKDELPDLQASCSHRYSQSYGLKLGICRDCGKPE